MPQKKIEHTLICGMTLSGKSHYARSLADASDRQTIILMPSRILDDDGPAWADLGAHVYIHQDRFLKAVWASRNALIMVDEAQEYCTLSNTAMHPITTSSRHYGHRAVLIAQRFTKVCTTMRGQCNVVVAFRQGRNDAREMADDFANQELLDGVQKLKEYQYIKADRFGKTIKGKVLK